MTRDSQFEKLRIGGAIVPRAISISRSPSPITQLFTLNSKESVVNLYVGNLSRQATEDDLRQAFEAHGEVTSVAIIKDKFSGEPRGFAFVEMPAKAQAIAAMRAMNGQEIMGRAIIVNEAKPREERRRGGGGGGHRRSGGGGGGGGRFYR
jgi:RNA recognition motif-containing protein